MGDFFGTVQQPDWTRINLLFNDDANTIRSNQALASNYAPEAASLANQGAQQNLDDRSTLRGLAPGLASTDPTIRSNALANAAVLPTIGTGAVNSLSEDAARAATTKLQLLQYGNALPQLPYGGGGQINSLLQPNALASPLQGQGQGASPAFLDQMSGRESDGNAGVVNRQGYSGNFQFGSGRLSDLGMYQPAQGENPNGNQWHGTFNIPGFPNVQTHGQFLANPDAQRMAAELHFKDIGNNIDNTPGAQDFDRSGLMAVAQLGGIHGMQQFVATGGRYNPGDNPAAPGGGTHLSDYYDKFAQGGPAAFVSTFGHPNGPLPQNHPARQQQIASNTGTAGMPQTATDASAASGVLSNPAPGSTVSDTPGQVQAKLAQMRAAQADGADPANQIAVDPSYAANMQAPTPGMGMPAPQAVAQARQELDGSLKDATPEAYNAAISQRAMEIINQTRAQQQQPATAGTSSALANPPPSASPGIVAPMTSVEAHTKASSELGAGASPAQVAARAQQLSSAGQMGMPAPPLPGAVAPQQAGGAPLNNLLASPAPAANAPRPIIPGSSIMTTAPFADQRFLPAAQGAPGGAPGQPINQLLAPPQAAVQPQNALYQAPAATPQAAPGQQPQGGGAPAAFDPLAGLPPGAKPITTGPAHIPMADPNVKGNGLAQTPDGAIHSYRLAPPEMGRQKLTNPDGSQTIFDTLGHPLYTSAPNTRDIQTKDYEADRKSAGDLADAANSAQTDQIRLTHALTLAGTLRTGANGGSRAEWANLAETYLPADLAKQFSTSLVGNGGAAAAQQFDKLMVQSAGSQERGVLGARGGYQATQLFMKANPGLNMQGSANQDILNMQIIGKQADAYYAQGAVSHFNDRGDAFRDGKGGYVPLTKYDQQWLSQRNPQIYAAAMGAATGQPFAKWTDGLNMKSPDDVQKVIGILRRAKPNSTVQWANGQPQMVGSN